jgi:hypothetical protein
MKIKIYFMAEEDLILGGKQGEEINEEEEEFEYEFTSRVEAIASAYSAISAVSDIDTAIMSKLDERRVQRIKRKSLRIIDSCIGEIYNELFFEEENNNEDE